VWKDLLGLNRVLVYLIRPWIGDGEFVERFALYHHSLFFDEGVRLIASFAGFSFRATRSRARLSFDVDDRQPQELDHGIVGGECPRALITFRNW
jgi:hypothetical protein